METLAPTRPQHEVQVRTHVGKVVNPHFEPARHATQYIAHPDFPWSKLRQTQPGVYESYVDVEPGVWTPIRIEVRGGVAQLFVHGSAQPALIVTDMKNPPASGRIALWIDTGTEAHFRRVRVTPY